MYLCYFALILSSLWCVFEWVCARRVHVPSRFFKVYNYCYYMYTGGIYINIQVFRKSVRNTRLNTTIRKGTREFIFLHHRYLFDTWYETSAGGLHAFFSVRDDAALKLNNNFFLSLCFPLCVWLSLCVCFSLSVFLSLSFSLSLSLFSLSVWEEDYNYVSELVSIFQ